MSKNGSLFVLSALSYKPFYDSLARGPRLKKTTVRLVDSPPHAFGVDLWPTLGDVIGREFLRRDARLAEQWQRSALELVIASRRHPQHSTPMQKLPAPAGFVLFPQPHGTGRHLGIGLVGSIGPADHSGLAA